MCRMPFVKPSVFNKTVTPCWRELTVTVPFNAVVSDLETALRDTYELKQYQKVPPAVCGCTRATICGLRAL